MFSEAWRRQKHLAVSLTANCARCLPATDEAAAGISEDKGKWRVGDRYRREYNLRQRTAGEEEIQS